MRDEEHFSLFGLLMDTLVDRELVDGDFRDWWNGPPIGLDSVVVHCSFRKSKETKQKARKGLISLNYKSATETWYVGKVTSLKFPDIVKGVSEIRLSFSYLRSKWRALNHLVSRNKSKASKKDAVRKGLRQSKSRLWLELFSGASPDLDWPVSTRDLRSLTPLLGLYGFLFENKTNWELIRIQVHVVAMPISIFNSAWLFFNSPIVNFSYWKSSWE